LFGQITTIGVSIRKMCADLKPSLIDLEAGDTATGANRKDAERLSERGFASKVCDSPAHETIDQCNSSV